MSKEQNALNDEKQRIYREMCNKFKNETGRIFKLDIEEFCVKLNQK